MASTVSETRRTLGMLVASPAIWAGHLLASYATVAIWCAKGVGPGRPLGGARMAVAIYTGLALGGIAFIAARARLRRRPGADGPAHDADAAESRERFLAFATLLLSGLSAVTVVFAGLAVAFLQDCR